MKISRETKIIILFFAIYFFFAWILTTNYFINHLQYLESKCVVSGWWEQWHEQIKEGVRMSGGVEGDSNQFRLMSFWLAEGTSKIFDQSIPSAYLIDRFIFTFLMFCLFHLFLLKWFKHKGAFLGTTILAAITPITYLPFIQESDYILQFLFLIGLFLIREKKYAWLALLVFVATFAKETIVFLIPFYFFVNWAKQKKFNNIVQTISLFFIWGGAFYITRNLFYEGGENSPLWQLPYNIIALKEYFVNYSPFMNIALSYIPLFGIFWVLSFWDLKIKPHFFKAAALFIVVFMILHFLMGWPEETRIILPLAFLVIPSSMLSINYLLNKNLNN